MLSIELGATAVALLVLIYWFGGRTDWIGAVTRYGDYVAVVLAGDVVVALYLALRVERQRSVRYVSIIFHLALVVVFIAAEIVWRLDLLPD
jgi:hypothetical protein